jgi:drug/metabolite transporter (DMT)-like permease
MQNKNILLIIVSNILWSFVPVIVSGLFDEFSIITIIFLRFFFSAIVLLVIAVLLVLINNRNPSNSRIELKELFRFTLDKNKDFYNIRNIFYLMILGYFGIILQLVFFFLALKLTTISLTMIGFQLSIIIIAFYEHGNKSEKLDLFKILYLIVLIFSIGIIIFVKAEQSGVTITSTGFLYIILFSVCLTFFHIVSAMDKLRRRELEIINRNENYKIPRLLVKISLMFFTGIALMFPIFLLLNLFQTDLSSEIQQFFYELTIISIILLRWEIIVLILFTTIIPYFLLFTAFAKWNPYSLTYRQWSSILSTIEPIGGILFGVLFGVETFDTLFLAVVLFLLILSIMLRFIHESVNKVNALIAINLKQGNMERFPIKLLKYDGVSSVQYMVGTYDIILTIKANSLKDVYYLVNEELRNLEAIMNLKILFINKINKLTIN